MIKSSTDTMQDKVSVEDFYFVEFIMVVIRFY